MVIREALREFGADPEAAMRRLLGDEKLFLILLREFGDDPDIRKLNHCPWRGTDPARSMRRTILKVEPQR